MKKILLSVMALAIAAFTFTSCEDVPMPYDVPGTGGGDKPVIVAQGDGTLATPFNIAALNNFINDGQNLDKEIYVTGKISQIKSLDVSKYTRAQYYISDDGTSNNQFYVYNGKFLNGADFTADDQIKVGDSVVIRGTLTTYQGAYQINQNSVIVSLNGSEPGEQPTPVVPTGDNLLPNGDFEAWADGVPANWKSTTTASSATVSQSTDAHSGSYAALVKGDANSNKRLAYKELTLKAGTYKFSYYAKATTADVCQVNAGYVPVTDGKVGSYKYESGYPQINNTEWKEISTTFTLEAQTTVNLLVLNYKTTEGKNVAQDILVDDAALVTSDGGIVEGGDQTPPVDTQKGTEYTKVTTISAGKYVIAAPVSETSYAVATGIDASKTYGYLPYVDGTVAGSTLTVAEGNEFTFTATTGGYYIQDASGRYYYMTGTYNSFNLSADVPTEGGVFDITFDGSGNVVIKNVEKQKTVQYSTQYKSYGAYPDVTNVLPCLFKK